MPPRIQLPSLSSLSQGFRSLNVSPAAAPSASQTCCRTFSSTSSDRASTVAQRRRHRDPYAIAQARARKAANISRQEVLKKERTEALGDPIRGITTPFVQSFDTAGLPTASSSSPSDIHTISHDQSDAVSQSPRPNALDDEHRNFFLKRDEINDAIARSALLVAPMSTFDDIPGEQQSGSAEHETKHANATEALSRIASLANASSKDRLRVNMQRCIETFGRHNTDKFLDPKPAVSETLSSKTHAVEKTPRVGPDTGSSEVQIAILTAKIRTLADFLQTRGRTDKVNKRNLRLLVHKRQKHLAYLRRRERGGPRWQHLIETLGLTEGTWKGEISL